MRGALEKGFTERATLENVMLEELRAPYIFNNRMSVGSFLPCSEGHQEHLVINMHILLDLGGRKYNLHHNEICALILSETP